MFIYQLVMVLKPSYYFSHTAGVRKIRCKVNYFNQ